MNWQLHKIIPLAEGTLVSLGLGAISAMAFNDIVGGFVFYSLYGYALMETME